MRVVARIGVGVLVIAAACSSVGDSSRPQGMPPQEVEQVLARYAAQSEASAAGAALLADILADGVVTFDEYERAKSAAIECMRAEGFDVDGPLHYPNGLLVVSPGYDPRLALTAIFRNVDDDEEEARRRSDVDQACQNEWSFDVERVWQRQHEPTQEDVERWYERLWACARELDLPISDPPNVPEDMRLPLAAGCRPWEE